MLCSRLPIVLLALSTLAGSAGLAAEHSLPPQETAGRPGPTACPAPVAAPAPASSPSVAEREEELATRVLHLVDLLDLRRLVSGFDDPLARARIDLARVEGAVRELEPARRERLLLGVIDLRSRLRDYGEATRPTPPSDPATAERLAALLDSSLDLAAHLGALLEAPAPTAPSPTAAGPTVSAAATGSTCADAIPIGDGTFSGTTIGAGRDGSSSCELSGSTSEDSWYLYTAPVSGPAELEVTSLAAVISLYSGCPGTASNELTCDQSTGFPNVAHVFRSMSAGEQVRVRVSGSFSSGGFFLTTGPAGAVSGFVTNAITGAPLSGVVVRLFGGDGVLVTSTATAGDGSYRVDAPVGTVYVSTSSDFLDQLWDGLPCESFCDPTAGTPIQVAAGATVQDIDFALVPFGSIAGQVTDAITGDPVTWVDVTVLDSFGVFVGSTLTGADGAYQVGGLRGGIYFVRTTSSLLDELFDDLVCEAGRCDLTAGTGVPVIEGTTTPGIDFALHPGGKIAGQVTDVKTGSPIVGASVEVFDAQGRSLGDVATAADGTYTRDQLPSGSFFVRTLNFSGYVDELYDSLRCDPTCDPLTGTPVAVVGDLTTSGIDFALTPFGSLSGTLRDATTSAPIAGGKVLIFRSSQSGFFPTEIVTTAADGTYSSGPISADTFFVMAGKGSPAASDPTTYATQLWNGHPCDPGCTVSAGDLVTVVDAAETPGIDFALVPEGVISGTVKDAVDGSPIVGSVTVYRADGSSAGTVSIDSTTGAYTFRLAPGTYTLVARSPFNVDQLYSGLLCEGSCDVTTGTPVAVTSKATTTIDILLDRLGAIAGTVTEIGSGLPVPAFVDLYDASGLPFSSLLTDFDGTYLFPSLLPGTYFVEAEMASSSTPFPSQLWQAIPCGPSCAPATGTPVTVALNSTTSNIDFVVALDASVGGRVASVVSGDGVGGITVDLFDGGGTRLTSVLTDDQGAWLMPNVRPGSYFVRTRSLLFSDQLWRDLPCQPGCDPTTGTPIVAGSGQAVSGIDFSLAGCDSPQQRTVSHFTFLSSQAVEACDTVTADPDVHVGGTADVVFRAGHTIVLGDGFSVGSGASFRAEIRPELLLP